MSVFGDMIANDMDIMDALATVTVLKIDPDTGATLATANNVIVVKRAVDTGIGIAVGEGGEVPKESGKFHLKANSIGFVPKKRDEIIEDDGTKWVIDSVRSVAFATRYVCDVTGIV